MDVSAKNLVISVMVQVSRQCLVHTRHADDWNKARLMRGSELESSTWKGKLSSCLFVCLFSWLVGWLVGWLVVCLFGWLVGWLVVWLFGWFQCGFKHFICSPKSWEMIQVDWRICLIFFIQGWC